MIIKLDYYLSAANIIVKLLLIVVLIPSVVELT